MNHIYRLVWSVAQQRFVVASELARARGGASSVNKKVLAPAVSAALLTLSGINNIATAAELCSGPGDITISSPSTGTCNLGDNVTLRIDKFGALSTNPAAIFVFSFDPDVTITNNGNITGTHYGIEFTGATMGTITNTGTITGTSEDAISLNTGSSVNAILNSGMLDGGNHGIHLYDTTVSNGIDNVTNGDIEAKIWGRSGNGILVESVSSISGGVNNSGIIEGGVNGVHVYGATISDGLNNSGTIQGDQHGVAVTAFEVFGTVAGRLEGGLTNSGTIRGASRAIYVNGSSIDKIVNDGSILASNGEGVLLASGSSISEGLKNSGIIQGGFFGVSVISQSTLSGGLTNSGTISSGDPINFPSIFVGGDATIDEIIIAGNNTAKFIGEVFAKNTPVTIANGASYTMDDGQLFTLTNSSFTNAGTLGVAAGGTGTITGNFTQDAAGIFRVNVTDDTTYGKLVVSGTATLPSNAKIDVNVIGSPSLTLGAKLTDVIKANTSLVGGDSFTVTDNSVLFNFSGSKNGNAVDLTIEQGLSVGDANTSVGNSPGNGAAQVLDEIIADPTLSADPEWQPVITALGQLGTEQEVAEAVSQTLPLLTGSATPALGNALSGTNRVVQARLDGNRGLSSGDMAYTDKHAWGKVYGSWHDQDDRKGVSGFDGDSQGLILGMDGDVNERTKLGLAVGYSRTSIDSNSRVAPNSADIDSYQLVGYGSYALEGASEFSFQADYGWSNTKGARTITFVSPTRVAQSDYDSDSFHVGVGWGKTLENTQVDQLAPSVKLDYTYIESDSYTETGAGALNLSVQSNDVEALIVSADLKASHQVDETTSLEGVVGVGYDLINEQAVISSSYVGGGSSFVVRGLDPDPLIGRLGFGLNKQLDNGAELNLRYDLEGREDYTNQTASVKLRWAF